MSDDHIARGTTHARHASEAISANLNHVADSPAQDLLAAAHGNASAGGPTGLDDRELRHELRNALTAAAGYTQWLQRRSARRANERERRALEAIQQGIARARVPLGRAELGGSGPGRLASRPG